MRPLFCIYAESALMWRQNRDMNLLINIYCFAFHGRFKFGRNNSLIAHPPTIYLSRPCWLKLVFLMLSICQLFLIILLGQTADLDTFLVITLHCIGSQGNYCRSCNNHRHNNLCFFVCSFVHAQRLS